MISVSLQGHGPFLESHDGGALILKDLLVRMDPNKKFCPQPSSLKHCSSMTYLYQSALVITIEILRAHRGG